MKSDTCKVGNHYSYAALPLTDKTCRNQGKRLTKCRYRQKNIAVDKKNVARFLLSSLCTVDKDILPGDIVKMRVCRPTRQPNKPQGHQQTILNLLNFLCPSGEIGQRYNNLSAARTAPVSICRRLYDTYTKR